MTDDPRKTENEKWKKACQTEEENNNLYLIDVR